MPTPFRLQAPAAPESDLLRSVLQALALHRVFCWRNNSGVTVLGKGKARRVIRGAPAGSPDILGVIPGSDGALFGFELKTATGRVSASQREWHEKARAQGVRIAVVRSVKDSLRVLETWTEEARGVLQKRAGS
jgi:hypothetical protein